MRFIADENISNAKLYLRLGDPQVEFIPDALIVAIRRKGFSVKNIKEENLIGISDHELLSIANKEKRIIITFDKDFTNLFQFPLKSHSGIVVLRYTRKHKFHSDSMFSPNSKVPNNLERNLCTLLYTNKHVQNVIIQFCYLLDSPLKEKLEKSLCEVFDNYLRIHRES